MEKENGFGIMDRFTKANGNWELRADTAFGNHQKEIHTKVNGF